MCPQCKLPAQIRLFDLEYLPTTLLYDINQYAVLDVERNADLLIGTTKTKLGLLGALDLVLQLVHYVVFLEYEPRLLDGAILVQMDAETDRNNKPVKGVDELGQCCFQFQDSKVLDYSHD